MKKNIILCLVALILSLIAACGFINHPIIEARFAGFLAVFYGGGIFGHYLCEILCDIFIPKRKDKGEENGNS